MPHTFYSRGRSRFHYHITNSRRNGKGNRYEVFSSGIGSKGIGDMQGMLHGRFYTVYGGQNHWQMTHRQNQMPAELGRTFDNDDLVAEDTSSLVLASIPHMLGVRQPFYSILAVFFPLVLAAAVAKFVSE